MALNKWHIDLDAEYDYVVVLICNTTGECVPVALCPSAMTAVWVCSNIVNFKAYNWRTGEKPYADPEEN